MSVSLSITWPDGSHEDVGIASQRNAVRWAELASAMGLEFVPHFHHFLAVDAANIDRILEEMHVFRAGLSESNQPQDYLEAAGRPVAALERLKCSAGWKASIG